MGGVALLRHLSCTAGARAQGQEVWRGFGVGVGVWRVCVGRCVGGSVGGRDVIRESERGGGWGVVKTGLENALCARAKQWGGPTLHVWSIPAEAPTVGLSWFMRAKLSMLFTVVNSRQQPRSSLASAWLPGTRYGV